MKCTVRVVTSLAAISFSAAVASATPLLVQSDPNGLAFFGNLATNTSGFYEIANTGTEINSVVYTPPNLGAGGSVMWIAGQNVGTGSEVDASLAELADGLQSYAEYTLRFTSQGTYRVHWSGQRTGAPQIVAEGNSTGSNDSLWIGPVDQDHTATTNWTQLSLSAGAISYRSSNALWVIDNTNVNKNLTFTIGLREDGPIYDRVAFVLEDSGILPGELHVIPEPSGIALGISAGVLLLLCAVRHRSQVLPHPIAV